jgi:hypothetical protein
MQLPQIEPKFNLGDVVWVIQGNNVNRCVLGSKVYSIKLELFIAKQGEPPVLVCTGYQLGVMNFDVLDAISSSYPHDKVYSTKEEAETLAKWHPVENISLEEWERAIGNRENDDSLDTCELSRCCAIISDIRDILLDCKENQGLIERDLLKLSDLLKSHDFPLYENLLPDGQGSKNLAKILGQLGILDLVK